MVSARAHSNIALIKYWGKRDIPLNLPSVGSLSLTLDAFYTDTTLTAAKEDSFWLNEGKRPLHEGERVFAHLDAFCQSHKIERPPLEVRSVNHVPTASGLASSASAFCALTLAADAHFETQLSKDKLSEWSRRGSGSAARSVYGGFALMKKGERADGSDSVACALESPLDVSMVVVQTTASEKKVSSTKGMERTRLTSPYFEPWVTSHPQDLLDAKSATESGDLKTLGELMEHSTAKMHASALGAKPPLWYFSGRTWDIVNEVRNLRESGLPCWYTMDAGPHVKILCKSSDAERVKTHFESKENITAVRISGAGKGAHILS